MRLVKFFCRSLTHAEMSQLPTHKCRRIFYNYNNYYFIALSICLFLTVDPEDGKTDIHKMSNQKERAEALSFFSLSVLFYILSENTLSL